MTTTVMRISCYSLVSYQKKGAELCILFHVNSFLGQVSFISPLTSEVKCTKKTSCFSLHLSNRNSLCSSPPFLEVRRLTFIGCATMTFFIGIFPAGYVQPAGFSQRVSFIRDQKVKGEKTQNIYALS